MELKIDSDFQSHIPVLRKDERHILEESIKTEGCREPLIVWQEEGVLLDGHNRYEICIRLGIEFDVLKISIPDKEAAIAWIENNQLGRRNLTPDQFRYYLGRKYEREKKEEGRPGKLRQNDEVKTGETANRIAKEHGTSPRTVGRAGEYSKNLDAVAEVAGLEVKQDILSGKEKVTNNELKEYAEATKEASPSDGKQWFQEQKEKHNHRAQGTGENEWYTPEKYIDIVRNVLSEIDLDPASSEFANETVAALRFYTPQEDGLSRKWFGRVWLNPPYSQPAINDFANKTINEWRSGRVQSAIILTHNYTDTRWFHVLASECQAICFTKGRIAFENALGEKAAPTQGQVFFYFGNDQYCFKENFSQIGIVLEAR